MRPAPRAVAGGRSLPAGERRDRRPAARAGRGLWGRTACAARAGPGGASPPAGMPGLRPAGACADRGGGRGGAYGLPACRCALPRPGRRAAGARQASRQHTRGFSPPPAGRKGPAACAAHGSLVARPAGRPHCAAGAQAALFPGAAGALPDHMRGRRDALPHVWILPSRRALRGLAARCCGGAPGLFRGTGRSGAGAGVHSHASAGSHPLPAQMPGPLPLGLLRILPARFPRRVPKGSASAERRLGLRKAGFVGAGQAAAAPLR